jgi:hypothetical protein
VRLPTVFILLIAPLLLSSPARAASSAPCVDQLHDALAASRSLPSAQRTSDYGLYVQFYQCLQRPATEVPAWAALREQLAHAAEAYISRRLAPEAYRAFVLDRQHKAERMRTSPSYAEAVARGDRDGDFVPDSADRCPDSPAFTPTDDNGCPVQCPVEPTPENTSDPVCLAKAPPTVPGEPVGPMLEPTVPINLACEDVQPSTSAPIAWGMRDTERSNGVAFPGNKSEGQLGYYFSVRRTNAQAPGCEFWYALQFSFRDPTNSTFPPLDIVSVLFSSKEDENANGSSFARFPLFYRFSYTQGDVVRFDDAPLSAGRKRLSDNLRRYKDVSLRVRVVTGAQQTSAWSGYVRKAEGPPIEVKLPLP